MKKKDTIFGDKIPSYIFSSFLGFLLSGPIGLILGPVVRFYKKKTWKLWIILLFPVSFVIAQLFISMNIGYSFAVSPLYLSRYEKIRFEKYNCDPYLFFSNEELAKDPSLLQKYLDEKKQFCSENANYVFLKAGSLVVNGKTKEGIELMNNYLIKYPNIENSEEVKRMIEKWSGIEEQAN